MRYPCRLAFLLNPHPFSAIMPRLIQQTVQTRFERQNMLGHVMTNPWWMFIIIGLFAGIVSGALGLGGGIIIVPALALVAAFPQKSAQGIALAVMVPLALLGACRYWRNDGIDVNLKLAALIAVGALLGTLIGTELAIRLPGHVLRKAFAVFLVLVAFRMFIGANKAESPASRGMINDHNTATLQEHNIHN